MTITRTMTRWRVLLPSVLAGLLLGLGLRSMTRGGPDPVEVPDPAENPENVAEDEVPPAKKGLLLDLGNELCPVLGNAVDGKTYSEWNGLLVGH